MRQVTLEIWNEIYDDIYKRLRELCEEKGKTEKECKEIMEEIKKILVTTSENNLSNTKVN